MRERDEKRGEGEGRKDSGREGERERGSRRELERQRDREIKNPFSLQFSLFPRASKYSTDHCETVACQNCPF